MRHCIKDSVKPSAVPSCDVAYQGTKQTDFIWPADLLDLTAVDEDNDRNWWLVYTRSRQEKQIAKRLVALRAGFYLPLAEKRTYTRGRIRRSQVPLFSGYVFLYGDMDIRLAALETNCVSSITRVDDGEQLRGELRRLAGLLEMKVPLNLESRLTSGTQVRIKAGPFRGLEGQIIRREGKTRLAVSVNYIQMGASVVLDDCCVEPL